MRLSPYFPFALLFIGSPAWSQTAPTPASRPNIFTVESEVAPQWSSPNPFDYGEVTDATNVSLTLTAKPKVSEAFSLEFKLGPKAVLDDDHDNPSGAESALGASGKIKFPAGSFALFATAAYEKKFKNFFDESNGSKKVYTAGVEYGYAIKWVDKMKLSAVLLGGITDLTNDAADDTFAQIVGKFETPLWWVAKLNLEANGTRRWSDDANATVGFKERRTEWGASIGLNFAPAIVKLTKGNPDNPWLRNFKFGYNYFRRDSNIPGADKRSSSPSLSFSIGQDF